MNMFAKNTADSVESYLAGVPDDRKETIDFMHDFIQKAVPSFTPYFAYNMLGYGEFKYYDKRAKQAKSWPIVALANQKNYVSLYVCAVDGDEYLAEIYSDKLGKVSTGKSCIRFKKLEDLNLDVVREVLVKASQSAGMVGAETVKD